MDRYKLTDSVYWDAFHGFATFHKHIPTNLKDHLFLPLQTIIVLSKVIIINEICHLPQSLPVID